MYCDFQPAFLFLLTQGTKRKRSSTMLIMKRSSAKLIIKQKIYYIIKKIENWACKESQFSIFILLMLLAKKVVDGLYGVEC